MAKWENEGILRLEFRFTYAMIWLNLRYILVSELHIMVLAYSEMVKSFCNKLWLNILNYEEISILKNLIWTKDISNSFQLFQRCYVALQSADIA